MIRISDKARAISDTGTSPKAEPTVEQALTTAADSKEPLRPAAHLTQGGTLPTGALPPPPPDATAASGNAGAIVSTSPTDLAARVELATTLTLAGGSGTEADRAVGVAELSKLPLPLLQLLAGIGVRLVMCRDSVTDFAAGLQGVTPAGWPPGFTWDDVPAAYLTDLKRVVVATQDVDGARALPPTGDGHSSFNVLLHEAGHAVDLALSSSLDADFLAAYAADFAALPHYLQQAGEAGQREAFAEIFARHVAGDATLHTALPNLAAFLESLLADP